MKVVMIDLLTQLYTDADNLKGKRLLINIITVLFFSLIVVGALAIYITQANLNKREQEEAARLAAESSQNETLFVSYKGVVTFVGDNMYPLDKVTYVLTDHQGNDIVLLRSDDARLSVVEGLFVDVSGRKSKSRDGKNDILTVDKVTIKNVSN